MNVFLAMQMAQIEAVSLKSPALRSALSLGAPVFRAIQVALIEAVSFRSPAPRGLRTLLSLGAPVFRVAWHGGAWRGAAPPDGVSHSAASLVAAHVGAVWRGVLPRGAPPSGTTVRAGLVAGGFGVLGLLMGLAGRLVLRRSILRMVCRPPWCELAAAGLSALVGWRAAVGQLPWWWLPVPLLLGWFTVPLTAADFRHRRLPDILTLSAYPVIGLALVVASVAGPGLASRALLGAVLFGGAHALVRVLAPTALGGGDVKLAGSLGAVLGAVGWPALAVAAALAGCVTAALALAAGTGSAPHGPGLLAATWLIAAFPGGHLPALR